jgi:2-oxo-4-hydroxy-4-carboxy-5-ureidoimidazoline decarboxylase
VLDVSDSELRERLTAALGVARWVDELAAQAPFADVGTLVAAGRAAATPLSDAELDEAVVHHPRIGERAEGTGSASRLSAGEQSGLGRADEGVDAVIARGNKVYEERFGRVFLIRAAGRSREEVADELQRRLTSAPDEEAEEAKEQLRQIMELRLRTLFPEDGTPS